MTVVIESSVVPLPGLALRSPIEIADGTRIRDLLHPDDIAENELYLLPVVNGEAAKLDRALRDGDRLRFFRLSAGG